MHVEDWSRHGFLNHRNREQTGDLVGRRGNGNSGCIKLRKNPAPAMGISSSKTVLNLEFGACVGTRFGCSPFVPRLRRE